MYKFLVNIFVSLFIPKARRGEVKYNLLGVFNRMRVRRRAKSVGKNLFCGQNPVIVNKQTVIKDNVHINGLNILGSGDVTIGNYCHFGTELLIISDSHNYEGALIPYDKTLIKKETIIEDFVWIGARVTILPGAKIGKGAIIQAGSVVRGEIPPYSLAGGNPAKVFKYRDIEHFKTLEEQGKFN